MWRYALDSLDLNLGWYLDYAYCTLYTLTHSSIIECNTIDLQVRICRFSSCGRTTVRLPVTALTHHGCSQHSTMPCQSTTRGLKWSTTPEKRTYEIMVVQASWPSNRYYLIANKQEYRIHILQHVYNMYALYYTIIYYIHIHIISRNASAHLWRSRSLPRYSEICARDMIPSIWTSHLKRWQD